MHFLFYLVWCIGLPTAAGSDFNYIAHAGVLVVIRESVQAWQQDPEVNLRPIGEFRKLVSTLEADQGWFQLTQRSMRKKAATDILKVKLLELETVKAPGELSDDFHETLMKVIGELEALSYSKTLGSRFRLVIGW